MGIVLTVLEPPHHPEPAVVAALPPGAGRVIDSEPRLVSPRFDTLIVTSRGLIVRDHVTGDFQGVPWVNFSLEAHLRQHSRHAVLTLWLDNRRPLEVSITRRLALNIASIAPVLQLDPKATVDDVVIAAPSPVVDLRDPVRTVESRPEPVPVGVSAAVSPVKARNGSPRTADDWKRANALAPVPADRVQGLPPPTMVTNQILTEPAGGPGRGAPVAPSPPESLDIHALHRLDGRATAPDRNPRFGRVAVGIAILALAGAVGGAASVLIDRNDPALTGQAPVITSEAVDPASVD